MSEPKANGTMKKDKKQAALDKLNKVWSRKNLPLKKGATQAVPGEGNANADIMFIGEAPGAKEDALGRPFVGAAGKFLDELIGVAGLTRKDVFIGNVVKHRPPSNRDPLPAEIAAYSPWLAEQIKIIKPKVIVTLGRFSMEYMLGTPASSPTPAKASTYAKASADKSAGKAGYSITKIHGQPQRKDGMIIVPMFHPAAALYRGNLRAVLKEDFAKLPKIVKQIKKKPRKRK